MQQLAAAHTWRLGGVWRGVKAQEGDIPQKRKGIALCSKHGRAGVSAGVPPPHPQPALEAQRTHPSCWLHC
jgi:hypothetical protein